MSGLSVRVPVAQFLLYVDAAADGFDDARKFKQKPVAHRFDHAAAEDPNGRVDNIGLQRAHRAERAFFVIAHQPGIPDHIRRDDCGQTSGWVCVAHALPQAELAVGFTHLQHFAFYLSHRVSKGASDQRERQRLFDSGQTQSALTPIACLLSEIARGGAEIALTPALQPL